MSEERQVQPAIPVERTIADSVLNRIAAMEKEQGFALPAGYAVSNELKAAWLTILSVKDRQGSPALAVCKKESIANALLDMVTQGISVGRKQGYFIVYGTSLQLQRSYFGDMAVAKRVCPQIADIACDVVRQGQSYRIHADERGRKVCDVSNTDLTWDVLDAPIVGAYCTVYGQGGEILASDVMNMAQIERSWKQSKNYGGESSVHRKFPEEMAKKTVIRRVMKTLINTASEEDVVVASYNRTTEDEYINDEPERRGRPSLAEKMRRMRVAGEAAEAHPVVDVPAAEADAPDDGLEGPETFVSAEL